MNRLSGQHECALAKMMKGLRMLLQWVYPGFEHLKDKQIVFFDQGLINNPAFKIGIAFIDKRRDYARGGRCCEAERMELVDRTTADVPAAHYLV